jgi:hypothetical protein
VFVTGRLVQPGLMVVGKAGTDPRVGHQKGALLGQTSALPTNIRLGWKGPPGTNILGYYENP